MSQGFDPSQLLFPDPNGSTGQPTRRTSNASPFASGPVATVHQVRPAAGFGVPPGSAPFRPQASSQLNTPLVHKPAMDMPPPMFPDQPAYTSNQFQTHQFDTSSIDASQQFHTASLNAPTDNYGFQGASIQQEDPFQQLADPAFPISSTAFNMPPPPPAPMAQHNPFGSNFNSVESGGSDPFSTSDSGVFARPPPLPPARRDSFNNPFETVPTNDPYRQMHLQSPAAPPPPAAPFLNYNTTPPPQQNYSAVPSPTVFNQVPPSASPKLPLRPPPSPQRQTSRDITPAPRTVDDLFQEFMSNVSPDKLPAAQPSTFDMPPSLETLVHLFNQQLWAQLESKAWSMLGQPDPEFNLQVHSWAMVALMKQGKIDDLEQQIILLGDLDHAQYQYESYPDRYPTTRGSFVPMRLRYMAIQLPRLKNNNSMYETMASQLLVELQRNTFKIDDSFVWHQIVGINLVNSFVDRKKFDVAIRLATSLYEAQREHANKRQQVILLSRLGRIYLQMGDLRRAEDMFTEAAAINQLIDTPVEDCAARLLLNQGLLCFAKSKFKEALDSFNTILGVHSSDDPDDTPLTEPFGLWDDGDVVSCAANNMSICALYSCEVQTAVTVLETILQSDPRRHLHSAVVFNLSTLYDLICDNANSTSRKEMIKKVAEVYGVEHIEPSCFRI